MKVLNITPWHRDIIVALLLQLQDGEGVTIKIIVAGVGDKDEADPILHCGGNVLEVNILNSIQVDEPKLLSIL